MCEFTEICQYFRIVVNYRTKMTDILHEALQMFTMCRC